MAGSEDNGAHNAILDALNGLRADVREVRTEQRDLRDLVATFHGDTISVPQCERCQARWVDKRYFTVGLAVAVPCIGIITWLGGLVVR